MNPQSIGVAAAAGAVLVWLISRRRPSPLIGLDASAVALLNRTQIELVQEAACQSSPPGSGELEKPVGARGRAELLGHLQQQLCGDTPSRLAAIQTARAWAHRSTLPLLRRGLRDVSPEVAYQAAQAMELFRGQSSVSSVGSVAGSVAGSAARSPQGRLPRNAALTR